MSRSSGDVRGAVARLLSVDLPVRIAHVRNVKNLSSRELPTVDQIHDGQSPDEAFEGTASENRVWVVVTNPRHIPPMKLVDWRGGLPVYETRYACQIEIWALGLSWDNALVVRDEIESAVRFALIENANLSLDHTIETGYALHPPTVMSQMGVPMRLEKGAGWTWAPALVSADMRVEDAMASNDPTPPESIDRVGLYFVKMPQGETLADPGTPLEREQIKEWGYGEPQFVERFTQQPEEDDGQGGQ